MPEKNTHSKLSSGFIKKIAQLSTGYLSSKTLDKLFKLFEDEISMHFFSYSSESNLLRIISGMYDKVSFLNDCIKYPHYVEILFSISTNSNYLTDVLVRNPEYFYWVVNPSTMEIKLERNNFTKKIKEITSSYRSLNAKVNALKSLKRKETLRIGLKDIFNRAELLEVTEELSVLASVITAELFEICYNQVLVKYNIQNVESEYCIVALGKLGGNELNYSSDIDLMIFYDKDSTPIPKKSYNEILTEAVYLYIERATAVTSTGYLYRVDFRLRPDGRNSPLCRPIEEYLNYYESRGEDWERQMLIKTGFIGGSEKLFIKFKKYLKPFIYPASFSVSPTDQIKALKDNIEKNLKNDDNIKLVSGGIRDIEFSLQALQLLNGGRDNQIQESNSLAAIEKLEKKGLLTEKEAGTFKNSYTFYRRIEHYLQLMNDAQTHTIPSEEERLVQLSSFLGYKTPEEFKKTVTANRNSVLKIYRSIMGIKQKTVKPNLTLNNPNFENLKRAESNLLFLREGKGLLGQKEFDLESISAFRKIEPQLIKYLNSAMQPDVVLQNFVRVMRHPNIPSIWYKQFYNKKFFTAFLKLCEFSQKSVDLFSEDNELREYLLTGNVFEKLSPNNIPVNSSKKMMFILSVQFSLDLISADTAGKLLSSFIKKRIIYITENFSGLKDSGIEFFTAAMGSFSTGDMTLSSDIDLIFVAASIKDHINIQNKFLKLLLKLKDEFKPLDVDCRLRPEGKNSPLLWDIKTYIVYIQSRARIWELQAMSKINFISGSKKLYNTFVKAVGKRIESENKLNIKKEMMDMRARMYPKHISGISNLFNIKKSKGGKLDIEFICQYLILCNFHLFSILKGKSIIKSIAEISKLSEDFSKLKILIENYSFLKKLELTNQVIFNSSLPVLPSDKNKLHILSHRIGFTSTEEFTAHILSTTKLNSLLYNKYING